MYVKMVDYDQTVVSEPALFMDNTAVVAVSSEHYVA